MQKVGEEQKLTACRVERELRDGGVKMSFDLFLGAHAILKHSATVAWVARRVEAERGRWSAAGVVVLLLHLLPPVHCSPRFSGSRSFFHGTIEPTRALLAAQVPDQRVNTK